MKNVIIASLVLASTSVLANGQAIYDERYNYTMEATHNSIPEEFKNFFAVDSAVGQLYQAGYGPVVPEDAAAILRKHKDGQEAMANGVQRAADNCSAYKKALSAGFGSFYGTEQAAQGGVGGDRGMWAAICGAQSSDVVQGNDGTRIVFSGLGEYDRGYITVDTRTAGLWRPVAVRFERDGYMPYTASGMKAYTAALSLMKGSLDVIGGSVAKGGLDHIESGVVELVRIQMEAINNDTAGIELFLEKVEWLKNEKQRLTKVCESSSDEDGSFHRVETEDYQIGTACADLDYKSVEDYPDAELVRAAITVLKSM